MTSSTSTQWASELHSSARRGRSHGANGRCYHNASIGIVFALVGRNVMPRSTGSAKASGSRLAAVATWSFAFWRRTESCSNQPIRYVKRPVELLSERVRLIHIATQLRDRRGRRDVPE